MADKSTVVPYVDLNALPMPYEEGRLEVEEHHLLGEVAFHSSWLMPYRCEEQLRGWSGINGRHLVNECMYLPVLNATALDFLLAYPEIKRSIPASCKGLTVYFPKTIYIENRRDKYIRFLDIDTWESGDTLLNGFGYTSHCAALLLPGVKRNGNPLRPLNGKH